MAIKDITDRDIKSFLCGMVFTALLVVLSIIFGCSSGSFSDKEQEDYIKQYKAEQVF